MISNERQKELYHAHKEKQDKVWFNKKKYGEEYRQRPKVKIYRNKYWRRYRKENPEKRHIIEHKSIQKSRMKVLKAYSKDEKIVCANCGFDNILALHIDHINNGGVKHRREVAGGNCSNRSYYNWFIKNNFPKGFQILCANCNTIKEMKRRKVMIYTEGLGYV